MWTSSRAPNARTSRVAELYASALDRLGDPRPPQRVGALHTLELVAQQHPDCRQGVVDVLCAYLRMPTQGDDAVRLAGQRTLTAHLRVGQSTFWPGVSVDLAGARLTDFDLSGCRIDGALTLDGATLAGQTRCRGMTVAGPASLRNVTCTGHAWFERSVFRGTTRFDAANFNADAWFGEATFVGHTSFVGAQFGGHAWFAGCSFRAPVDFTEAVFRRSAGFRGAVAHASVNLSGTTFIGPARVSRRGDAWNVTSPGWRVSVDPDNEAVGQLLWVGHPELEARVA